MAEQALALELPRFDPMARLEVVGVDQHRLVFVNGHQIARYPCEDKTTERVVMTQLAEVLPLNDRDIAAAFGVHPVSLSRFVNEARQGGAAALVPLRTGPKEPTKLTPQMRERIRRLHKREGLSSREIAKRLSRGRRRISHASVAAVLRELKSESAPVPLPLEEKVEVEVDQPSLASVEAGDAGSSRYAGGMVLYAALGRLDLWGVLESLGAKAGPWRQFDWLRVVALIVFCFALRFRSIEDLKNARRKDLGVIVGTVQSPSVPTLRSKVVKLAESLEPEELSRELFQRYVELEPVWEGLYYVDGHFCPYYGQYPTPQGWNPQRRLATPGHTDVYVHDARGRVLFFLSQPLNDSLARAIPRMVKQIRAVHGSGPFTLVFDRGGYSGKLFRWLQKEGIGYITYLRGRKAKRRYPEEKFHWGWFSFEDERHYYRVYEKKTRVPGTGLVRTLVWLDEDGQQIPVLTNLKPELKPARIVLCLRLRWRQENSLKYLKENYAIDQIIQYGAEVERGEERLVKNPARTRLKERIAQARKEIESLEAEIGRALETNLESMRRTARGLKIALSGLRKQLRKKREVLSRLENRLRHTPSMVQVSKLKDGRPRMLLREDRRLIVNALKLAGYNAEKILALQFNKYYQHSKDVFSVFRSILHLPGRVHYVSPDCVDVHLERPQPEKVARALAKVLEEVNQEKPQMFGTGPVLQFSLAR